MATLALAAGVSVFAAGVGPSRADTSTSGGTLTIGQGIDFNPEFIPLIYGSLYTQNITAFAFDSLMSIDNHLNFIPWLAEKWSWSKDKKTLTMWLQPHANWSDGQPITSDDVLFFMDYLASKAYNTTLQGSYESLVDPVKGAQDIVNGKAKSFADTGGFTKISDKEFQIHVTNVDAAVLWSDISSYMPLPKQVLGKIPIKDWLSTPYDRKPTVVSGPYEFKDVSGQDSVTMVANPNYWKGPPKISTIVWKTVNPQVAPGLLANGELDMQLNGLQPSDVSKLKQLPNITVKTMPAMGYQYLGLKIKQHPEFNQKFRQALMYGINRQAIVDGLLKGMGKVLNAPIPESSWAAATPADGLNEYKYDPDKANQLLDEAGWKIGPDGWRVDPVTGKNSIPLDYPLGNTVRMASATAIAQDLAKVHLKIDLHQPQDFNALAKKVESDDPSIYMWLMGWSLSVDPDPRGMYDSNAAYNYPRWVDKQNDDLINATANEAAFDKNVRKQALVKWEVYYNQQVPYIFLYQADDIYAYTTNLQIPDNDWAVTGPLNP
ncbi:MAG: hypothetical protein K6T83_21000, partial [Alicyclobacillus sp.]|nr:hypothetical protein [Alicyclobacillus sp.]